MLRLALALALVIACAACGEPSPPAASNTASPTTSTTAVHPPAEFVGGPCPQTPQPVALLTGARCGELVVPENRTKPGGRALRLAVAIIPSVTQPSGAEPIVFVQGGPGTDGIVHPAVPNDVRINQKRDLILFTQRGNYTSKPALACPEIDRLDIRRVGMLSDAPPTGDALIQAARACHDRLAPNADLTAFNTIESVHDLADLRTALGINQWNVFAHSYGTGLALIYMRHDPNGIRSVALDGVMPPSHGAPGYAWTSAREAFDNMIKACVEQPACGARYPDLAKTFVEQVSRLEVRPVTTTVNVPEVGETTVVLDGGALMGWFATLATHFPAEFPASIDELARGNPQRIAERVATIRADPTNVGVMAQGLALSVMCSEWVPFETAEDARRRAQQAFPEFPDSVKEQAPQFAFIREECDVWKVPKASDAVVLGTTESAVPTLLLSGSFDGQTGPQFVRYVAPHLRRSTEATVPGVAHGVFSHPCGAMIIAAFFDTPEEPDTGCAQTTKPPPYLITSPP
jgi:pimeloyl-ACP methyl ester carboxylesterase